jgi:hypothetical protein
MFHHFLQRSTRNTMNFHQQNGKKKISQITVLLFVVTSLAASSVSTIFTQQTMAQTQPSLSLNTTCAGVFGRNPLLTFTFSGFPEGNTLLIRNDISSTITNLIIPSSGTATISLLGPTDINGRTLTFTALSDPNMNGVRDPGEDVTAQVTATIINCFPPIPAPTPSQQIQNLINIIYSLNVDNNVKNSLAAPLSQSVRLLTDNNLNNDVAVCGQLNAFINQVGAKMQNGQLTQEQASQLIQAAQPIKGALGCS